MSQAQSCRHGKGFARSFIFYYGNFAFNVAFVYRITISFNDGYRISNTRVLPYRAQSMIFISYKSFACGIIRRAVRPAVKYLTGICQAVSVWKLNGAYPFFHPNRSYTTACAVCVKGNLPAEKCGYFHIGSYRSFEVILLSRRLVYPIAEYFSVAVYGVVGRLCNLFTALHVYGLALGAVIGIKYHLINGRFFLSAALVQCPYCGKLNSLCGHCKLRARRIGFAVV